MTLYLNGTTGISGVDGSAGTPAVQGTDTNTGISFPAADTVAVNTGGSERVRCDSSGRVGIGTTSPARLLHVASSAADGAIVIDGGSSNAAFLDFRIAGTNKHYIGSANLLGSGTNSDMTVWNSANGYLNFGTNGTERARIDSSGRLLVGTSTSIENNALLQTYKASGINQVLVESGSLSNQQYVTYTLKSGNRYADLGIFKHAGITNPGPYLYLGEEDGASAYYWTDNSGNFRVSNNGDHIGTTSGTVVGTQTSDERLKNIIGPVEYGLDTINQLEPVRFALKSEPDTEKLGFIAQQVQPLIPQSVFDTKEHIEGEPEDAPTKLGMEYVALIPVLVNAIKELSAKNDALEARLAALEAS